MKTSASIRERILGSRPSRFSLSNEERHSLEMELEQILRSIASQPSLDRADKDLDALGELQELFALLQFKYDVELTKRQQELVRQFDRSDDPDLRAYFYKQVLAGSL